MRYAFLSPPILLSSAICIAWPRAARSHRPLPAAVSKSCVQGAHASPAVAIRFRLFSYVSLAGMACLENKRVVGRSFDSVTMSGISLAFRALMLLISS